MNGPVWRTVGAVGVMLGGMAATTAWGQVAPPPVAPTMVATRSPLVDAAIFVALAGGAVFAVGRSSKRV